MSIQREVLDANGSTSVTVTRGVLRSPTPTNPSVRLGFFAANEFAPAANSVLNAVNIPLSLGDALVDPQSLKFSTKIDRFGLNTGDIDNDGQVCWRDRVLVNRQVGLTLTSPNYDPRADLDLDGTITSADAATYLAVYLNTPQTAPPCPARCNGDTNYDGYVNTADITFFIARFGQTGLPYENGDINGDGTTNSADLTLLLGNIGATCI